MARCAANVGTILQAVSGNSVCRLGDCLARTEPDFIEPSEGRLQASTIKNYLLSLRKFCDFVTLKDILELTREEFCRFDRQLSIWNSSLTKDAKIRMVEKGAEDKGDEVAPHIIDKCIFEHIIAFIITDLCPTLINFHLINFHLIESQSNVQFQKAYLMYSKTPIVCG